jgi:hypothetical protein
MSKQELSHTIYNILISKRSNNEGSNGSDLARQTANEIALAIDAYVVEKLDKLKQALIAPSAYQGSGTGTVLITPGTSLVGYNPET